MITAFETSGASVLGRPLVLWVAVLCFARPVFADGAFPDEFTVHLPANAPNRIVLATNFGLVISEDAGQSWRFVCELFITGSTAVVINFYKMASDGALLAISFAHMWRSTDGGCSWTRAGGTVSSLSVTDAFIDPNDPTFVLAIATSSSVSGIYASHDGGLTFGPPLFPLTPDRLSGVEIASRPGVIYATQFQASPTGNSYLLKSTDGGAHWSQQQFPVAPGIQPRIAVVDPADSSKVYLRLTGPGTDSLAITTDDGRTLTTLITLSGANFFSSLLRAEDGSLYATTSSGDLYARRPSETSFTQRVGPRSRCLGQRAGSPRIYACGDWLLDGYNLGFSDDGANTFQPMMNFTQIAGPLTCPAVNDFCASQFIILQQALGIGLDAGTPGGGRPSTSSASHCSSVGFGGALALVLIRLFRGRARFRRRSSAEDT